ncbi:hypothetical protein niasHT_025204 [Heterodera trifolii]|uniref:Ubiquitin-like domain-containing protein n=1 Tax=Heterodera trifolii TaxID=157864 RepID=A0ABD2JLD6_9BILA
MKNSLFSVGIPSKLMTMLFMLMIMMMPPFTDAMKIQVKYGDKTTNVEVNEKDNVKALKKKIEEIKEFGNIPAEQQRLWSNSQALLNSKKCSDIKDGGPIIVSIVMEIRVGYEHKFESVWMNEKDNVQALKDKIAKIRKFGNISAGGQILRHLGSNGPVLDDSTETMKNYGIKHHDFIFVSIGIEILMQYRNSFKSVAMNKNDTVATLKQRIEKIEAFQHLTAEDQTMILYLNDKVLEDSKKSMEYYGIENGNCVYVSWNKFKIFMQYEKEAKKYELEVNAGDTVQSLKDKAVDTVKRSKEKLVPQKMDFSPKNLQLYYDTDASNKIECKNTIGCSGIMKGDTVFLSSQFAIVIWKLEKGVKFDEKQHVLNFKVYAGDTVQSVKDRIKEKKGEEWNCETGEIKLRKYNCTELLDNNQTLEYYGLGPPAQILDMGELTIGL